MVRLIIPLCFLLAISGCASVGPSEDDAGKRTFGTRLDDGRSSRMIKRNLKAAMPEIKDMNIDVHVYNGIALLTGQANLEAIKTKAGDIAAQPRHVTRVYNEIDIAGPTALLSRTNDGLLKTKIKTRMIGSRSVTSGRIKVVVENGVVFLLGLVTRDEAKSAVEEVRAVYGVQKIVQAFEFIN